MRTLIPAVVLVLFAAPACGTDGGADDGDDVPDGVVDVRVEIPAPDPNYLDLVTPEVQIEPGEERMYCYYLDNDEAELAVSTMQALQGEFGHHVVLLTTVEPEPAGTFEDCSAQEDMWKFRSFVLPIELPAGYGIRVPQGLQYVMQIHYVNAGEAPILVRDVARLRRIAIPDVQTWVATLTTNSLRVALPAGPTTEQFDCVLEQDLDLLLLGGHMHELGARFTIEVGPSLQELERLYLVDPWRPVYRDAPPVELMFGSPRRITAGTIVRTTCEWMNTGTTQVDFPAEMCASFGYLAGTDQPFHCAVGE
jgi:hypothetical protein